MTWKSSINAACEHAGTRVLVSFILLLPLAATLGQYWTSGFFRGTVAVDLLFWPGVEWHWAIHANAAVVVALMGSLYVAGIGWLFHRRTLGKAILAGVAAMIAAALVGNTVNWFTGWRELQILANMDFAGKANRMIFAQWQNPFWEEAVFRGIPLLCLAWLVKRQPRAARTGKWCYFLVPSLLFAAYHVPGHGYSRVVDTFLLSLVFAWLALRYRFWSVLVLHSVLDAVSVLSVGKMKSVPTAEVQWLADRFGVLNSAFSLVMLAVVILLIVLTVRYRWSHREHGLESAPLARVAVHNLDPE